MRSRPRCDEVERHPGHVALLARIVGEPVRLETVGGWAAEVPDHLPLGRGHGIEGPPRQAERGVHLLCVVRAEQRRPVDLGRHGDTGRGEDRRQDVHVLREHVGARATRAPRRERG
jgi:hypothetical protein